MNWYKRQVIAITEDEIEEEYRRYLKEKDEGDDVSDRYFYEDDEIENPDEKEEPYWHIPRSTYRSVVSPLPVIPQIKFPRDENGKLLPPNGLRERSEDYIRQNPY